MFGYVIDQLSGRCNFESSFCDWQAGNDAPEQLRRKETYASRWLTGPPGHRKSKLKSKKYFMFTVNVDSVYSHSAYSHTPDTLDIMTLHICFIRNLAQGLVLIVL